MALPQNAYPGFDNFQEASFQQEVTPPDVDPDVDMMCVRYNPAWAQVLMSACGQLTQVSAWAGTADEKNLAVSRATTLKEQLQKFEDCDMGCCGDPFGIPVLHRVDENGNLQISRDGGDTWVNDATDPRLTGTQYPPPVIDETHTKCDAATNANAHINDLITGTSTQLGGTGAVIEIAASIALLMFGIFIAPESLPALIPVILPICSALVFLGQAAWDAYFTSDVHTKILCALYCSVGENGRFTDAQYSELISRLTSDLPASGAKDLFIELVSRLGLIAINNYAAVGTSEGADCSSCDCGGCNVHNWVLYPDFIEAGATPPTYGENTITIPLFHGTTGDWYAILSTMDAGVCCNVESISFDETPASVLWAVTECGNTGGEYDTTPGIIGSTRGCDQPAVNRLYIQASASATVTFHFCP